MKIMDCIGNLKEDEVFMDLFENIIFDGSAEICFNKLKC